MIAMYNLILPTVQATMGPELSKNDNDNDNNNSKSKQPSFVRASLLLICTTFLLLDMLQVASAGVQEKDKCGAFEPNQYGYEVKEYELPLKDDYVLRLHRLVHPEDQHGGKKPLKKPYLLVHGLIGTSASFVTNVNADYKAPPKTFDPWKSIGALLAAEKEKYKYDWMSTAEKFRQTSRHEAKIEPASLKLRKLADSLELQFNADHMGFERNFRQAYNKYELPREALDYTSNSLAITLSNFGYDVWMVNLRGNHYSQFYHGPMSAVRPEYWNFGVEAIIREDLAATIEYICKTAKLDKDNEIGLVTYSYSSIYAMGLLTKFPRYQDRLRPIVMLAPTMLTGNREHKFTLNRLMIKAINMLVSRNGPIPVLRKVTENDSTATSVMKMICKLSIAKKLCFLMQNIIHGRAKKTLSVKGLLTTERAEKLWQRDINCGHTSRKVVHEILNNLSEYNINPNYKPFVPAGHSYLPGDGQAPPKPASIMIVHSKSDEISTQAEVALLRARAFKTMTLVDYVVQEDEFGHTDFLFSQKNEYLVNAEVARMATVHDWLLYYGPRPPKRKLPPPPPVSH